MIKWFITQRRKNLFKLEWVPDLCQLPLWSSEQKNGQNFSYSESWKYSLFFSLTDNSHKKSIFEKNQITETEKNFFLPKLDWLNFKNGFQVFFLLSVKMAPAQDFIFYFFSLNRRNERIQWNGIKGRSGEKKKIWNTTKNLGSGSIHQTPVLLQELENWFLIRASPFFTHLLSWGQFFKAFGFHLASKIAGHQYSEHWFVKFFYSFCQMDILFVSMHFMSTKPRQNSWEYVG